MLGGGLFMQIADPLPHRFFTETPGVGGRIKVRPEDFIVEEIPRYEPCGAGEHLYIRLKKREVAHSEMIGCLRRTFGVSTAAIGYAGMKDKHAVTSQNVSLHLPADPPSLDVDHKGIEILWAARHKNKLRRGHLVGNRFSIRIRDVDATKTPVVHRIMKQLASTGVPGYFGSQRFGYRCNNHLLGAMAIGGNWDGMVRELLGARGSEFPEYQRERREAFDAGRLDDAAAAWTTADRSEKIVSTALRNGEDAQSAIRAAGRSIVDFWTSALASAVFNRVLDERIDAGTVDTLLEGDLAWKHDSRAVFPVTAEELATGALPPRLTAFEISPSGPLWGAGMTHAGGGVSEAETRALAAADLAPEQLDTAVPRPEGARRPLRAPFENADVEGGTDEHGQYIRLSFDLPRGFYATVALREVMKNDTS